MAQRTVYVDDITGKEIEHGKGGTVRVGLDGAWYEVDLHDDSKAKLQEILKPYIDEDRRVRDQAPRAAARSTSSGLTRAPMSFKYSPETMAEATEWAKSEEGEKALEKGGVKYSGVGRTPYAVVEEYLKTQS